MTHNINKDRTVRYELYGHLLDASYVKPDDLQIKIRLHTSFARLCELSPREAHDMKLRDIQVIMKDGDYSDINELYTSYLFDLYEEKLLLSQKIQESAAIATKLQTPTNQVRAEYINLTLNKCDLNPISMSEFAKMAEDLESEGLETVEPERVALELERLNKVASPSSSSSSSSNVVQSNSSSPLKRKTPSLTDEDEIMSPPSSSSSSSDESLSPTGRSSISPTSRDDVISPTSDDDLSSKAGTSLNIGSSKKPKERKPFNPMIFKTGKSD